MEDEYVSVNLDDLPKVSISDLDGLKGTIRVGVDMEDGLLTHSVIFIEEDSDIVNVIAIYQEQVNVQ